MFTKTASFFVIFEISFVEEIRQKSFICKRYAKDLKDFVCRPVEL